LPRLDPAGNMPVMLPLKICLPTRAPSPPAGPEWLHEVKHDGYRMLAVRSGERVRLVSRRAVLIGAIASRRSSQPSRHWRRARARSDGQMIACDDSVTLVAFDLIEVDGLDLRCEPEGRQRGCWSAARLRWRQSRL
jgi:ATP-dependent DNA ligase